MSIEILIKNIDHIDEYNMNIIKKNLFIANLVSLDSHKNINESNIDIMHLLLDLYPNKDVDSNYLTWHPYFEITSSVFHHNPLATRKYYFIADNPIGLLMNLSYPEDTSFNTDDSIFSSKSKFKTLLDKLKMKYSIFDCTTQYHFSYINEVEKKDISFIKTKNSLAERFKELDANSNYAVFALFLDLLKEEQKTEKFNEFIYKNNIFNNFLVQKNIPKFEYFINKYNLDINIPNKDGIYPIMYIQDLESLIEFTNRFKNIDFSVQTPDNKTIQHCFIGKEDSIKMLEHLKTVNQKNYNNSNENLKELLILVESEFPKTVIQIFIKKNKLSQEDLSTIYDQNKNSLFQIILKQQKAAKLELFQNTSNLYSFNKDNLSILESFLIDNFQTDNKTSSYLNLLQKSFKQCIKQYKNNPALSFNILQHYVQGDKNPLFLNSQRHAPPTYSSDLPLLNKIFIEKFYDNQLLKSFLENTIENKDKRDEFFEYFKNNSNIDRTGSRDFDFLMYHFLENNQKINKDFSDFELTDFVDSIKLSSELTYLNENKLFIFRLFSNKINDFYESNTLNFKSFFDRTLTTFVNEISQFVEKTIQITIENSEDESTLEQDIKNNIHDNIFEKIAPLLPNILTIKHPSIMPLIKLIKPYNTNKELATLIDYSELNQVINNENQIKFKKVKI